MKPDRLIVIALALAAVVALVVIGQGDTGDGGGSGDTPKEAPKGAIEINFAYSPEKEKLLEPLIDEFNASGVEADGEQVFVSGEVVSSGDAEQKIAMRRLQPVAWSPSSSLWGRLLNFEADRELTDKDAPSIVRTPLVIAMWAPLARALGYPDKPIGFEEILALSRAPDGWASVGHPEFGDFRLVHTNPDFSTSGLSAVVAEYYAATGKREGLVRADIEGKARRTVRDIEQSIVHYGDTTLFVADQMRRDGPAYASAVAMEEVTLLDFNKDRAGQPKLVAIYPKEGTFFSDNPFFILKGDWVSPAERKGAKAFQQFLADQVTPKLGARFGFRPADLSVRAPEPIRPKNGADPSQPKQALSLPSPPVLAKIRQAWREDRKPANVMLVVDVSGSMADEDRLNHAKQGLSVFFEQIQPQDHVGLTSFNDQVRELVPIGKLSKNKPRLQRTISALVPGGGTSFLDATSDAFKRVDTLARRRDRINAVVVLSDGEDTDSSLSLGDIVGQLSGQGDSATQVRVFTIAYSASAEGAARALDEIAKASGGQSYEGGTENIELVYRSISSFF
jgi:Ca-activated chloride channel family protein